MPNLFTDLPDDLSQEHFQKLAGNANVRVERIVSRGHASPPDFWYDQPEHEWVLLLQGEAQLRFEGQRQPLRLKPGDFVLIEAHRKHRVEWTTPEEPTIWLAIHYSDGIEPPGSE